MRRRAVLLPQRPLPLVLLLVLVLAVALALLVPAVEGGFGVSARASAQTAIPKRLLRDDDAAAAGKEAEEEEREPAPPSFLEEVRWIEAVGQQKEGDRLIDLLID